MQVMKLTKEQSQDIKDQQSQKNITKRLLSTSVMFITKFVYRCSWQTNV